MSTYLEETVFAGIKLRVVRGDHSGPSGWILNPVTVVCRPEKQREIGDRRKGEREDGGRMKTEAERRGAQLQAKENLGPPEGGRGRKDPLPETWKGAQAHTHLDVKILASRLRENKFLPL